MCLWRRKKKVVEQLNALYLILLAQKSQQTQPVNTSQVTTSKQSQTSIASQPKAATTTQRHSLSISELLNKVRQQQPQNDISTSEPKVVESKPVGNIDQNKLEIVWNKFAQSISQTNTYLSAIMSAQPQAHGAEIVVKVNSKIVADNLLASRELISYLRCELANNSIIISPIIDATTNNGNEEVVYTSDQKLRKMKEANPIIEKFINELALDIDY